MALIIIIRQYFYDIKTIKSTNVQLLKYLNVYNFAILTSTWNKQDWTCMQFVCRKIRQMLRCFVLGIELFRYYCLWWPSLNLMCLVFYNILFYYCYMLWIICIFRKKYITLLVVLHSLYIGLWQRGTRKYLINKFIIANIKKKHVHNINLITYCFTPYAYIIISRKRGLQLNTS